MSDAMGSVGVILYGLFCLGWGAFLYGLLFSPTRGGRSTIRWTLDDVSFEGEGVSMEMFADQFVAGRVKPKTKHGQPAPIDGAVVVTLSNNDLATAEVSTEDPKLFRIVGNPANVTTPVVLEVNVDFDADLGEGTRTIRRTGHITLKPVEADDAASELEFGEPEDQILEAPAPAPETPVEPPVETVETPAPGIDISQDGETTAPTTES